MDSISHYALLKKGDTRTDVYRLIRFFKTNNLTTLLLYESEAKVGKSLASLMQSFAFLVDSVVELRYVEIESAIRRAIAVVKMRGSDHDKHLRELMISSNGVDIGDPFEMWNGVFTGAPRKTFMENISRNLAYV
jgi:circadian clock protein KaiC